MNFPSRAFDDTVADICAGAFSEAQAAELNALLRADSAALDEYLWRVEMHQRLAERAEFTAAPLLLREEVKIVRPRFRAALWPVLAAAACVLVTLGWWAVRPPRILEVLSVSGTVAWSGERGGQRAPLAAGERLPAGRIESTDDEALVRLRFADGTTLEFNGPMRAHIGEDAGKRVVVGKGVLTAKVAPQPPGQPMRVLSPTAELEVLGTVFTLDAAEDDARLSVAEGRVRLRRVADGGVAEVAARQSVVASRNAAESLEPARPPAPPPEWSATFHPARESILLGRLLPADAQTPRRIMAVGRKVEPGAPETRAVLPQLHLAPARTAGAAFATLVEGAEFEMRWRSRPRAVAAVVIYTRRPAGDLSGNFFIQINRTSATDADGWQLTRVPLSAFKLTRPGGPPTMTDLEATRISVTTHNKDAELEVAELRLLPPPQPR